MAQTLALGAEDDCERPAQRDRLQGLSAILDSPAFYPSVVEQAAELARLAGGRLRVVLCLADRDVREARTLARVPKPSQPTACERPPMLLKP